MTKLNLILIGLIFHSHFFISIAQNFQGKIIDANTKEPIEFVSIGIINSPFGCISDEKGNFSFHAKNQSDSAKVRISMIGYKSQEYTVKEFQEIKSEIELHEQLIPIPEVKVTPGNLELKYGTTKPHKSAGWSGWGGMHIRKGFEMGMKVNLGEDRVKLKSLNVYMHRQAFDTCLMRLHIRKAQDTLICEELLIENIILPVTKESGWVEFNLETYNIYCSHEVAVTMEWLKVTGMNPDRAMTIRKEKVQAYVLFKNSKDQTGIYRWGTEANWIVNGQKGPCMYVSVLK